MHSSTRELPILLAERLQREHSVSSIGTEVRLAPDGPTWDNIAKVLSQPIQTIDELLVAIATVTTESETVFNGIRDGLRHFFTTLRPEEQQVFFAMTLPFIQQAALGFNVLFPEVASAAVVDVIFGDFKPALKDVLLGPDLKPEGDRGRIPPRLVAQRDAKLTLSRLQVACVLAHAFFCTWPPQPPAYAKINFATLFRNASQPPEAAKLRAIVHYFERCAAREPLGSLTMQRRVLRETPAYSTSTKTLGRISIKSAGAIEDSVGALQVAFAQPAVGDGVLGGGCAQEDTRFAVCPELIAACLFCAPLEDNECLVISGAEQFCKCKGGGDSFQYDCDYHDPAPRDEAGSVQTRVVAIDSTDYRNVERSSQYANQHLLRETNKAFCGFTADPAPKVPVATGSWGCDAHLGDKQLKSLIQWIAASQAGCDLIYYTFGDEAVAEGLAEMCAMLHSKSVGYLWGLLAAYEVCQRRDGSSAPSVFAFVKREIENGAREVREIDLFARGLLTRSGSLNSVLGGPEFEEYIGTLAIEGDNAAAQAKVSMLAVFLQGRLDGFEDSKAADFEKHWTAKAESLKREDPLHGVDLLHLIGHVYSQQARKRAGGLESVAAKLAEKTEGLVVRRESIGAKSRLAQYQPDVMAGKALMLASEADSDDQPQALQQYLEVAFHDEGLHQQFKAHREEIESRLKAVCEAVFNEPPLSPRGNKGRVEALKLLGKVFQSVRPDSTPVSPR
eukprot:TRINITY_DN2796_c0_g1_i1.p1 TRINITY_DN2796_c0_g1~~TRINITY_DN2796_c0_g1_i1.p1  ORF type:complete len:730 (-),score=255.85 TRINITY_DN2796_c0_g1_i1:166-2355(-)